MASPITPTLPMSTAASATTAKEVMQQLGFVQQQMTLGQAAIAINTRVSTAGQLEVFSSLDDGTETALITDNTTLETVANNMISQNESINSDYLTLLQNLVSFLQSAITAEVVLG